MADLTVLISPTPLPKTHSLGRFTRRDVSPVSPPIMVTLEMADTPSSAPSSPTNRNFNEELLSPPRNTFKSRPKSHPSIPRRPASAPPQRTSFSLDLPEDSSRSSRAIFERRRLSSFSSSNTRGGELIRPAPPLFRPTTFWRKTRRSGVTGASYSPSSHLIRRSTYIAAGLKLDNPIADLSALCVESRVGFVLALASGRAVAAHDAVHGQPTRTSISHYNINYLPRQAAPLSTSSGTSALNPGLSVTTSTTASGSGSPTGSVVAVTDTAAIPPPTYPTIIHISALPPSTSQPPFIPSKYRKCLNSNMHMPAILLSPYVIAPISAIFGLIQGISFAWCCIGRRKCSRRRNSRRRSQSLEPGPPYASTPVEDDEQTHLVSRNLGAFNLHDGSPSKYSVHGSKYISSQGSLWLEREISRRSQQAGSNRITDTSGGTLEKAFLWPVDPSRNIKIEEEDPFLVPPSRTPTTRTAATTNMSFQSAEENPVTLDSLGHKSIRQGILKRLKFGTFNRRPRSATSLDAGHDEVVNSEKKMSINTPSRVSSITRTRSQSTHYSRRRDTRHKRSESDLHLDDVRRPERMYSPASTPRKERSLVRGVGEKDETEWVAGTGFRLVQEDAILPLTPSRMPVLGREDEVCVTGEVRGQDSVFVSPRDSRSPSAIRESVSGWLDGMISSHSQLAEVDKYTAMPVHKTPTKKTDGPSPSRNSRSKRNSHRSTSKFLSQFDSSILPSCPLQVMPPPLESQVLSCSPFMPPSVSVPLAPPMPATETCVSTKQTTSVHLSTPLPLPFATSPETSPFRNLLSKDLAIYDATSPHDTDPQEPENAMSPSPRNMAMKHNRGIRHSVSG
ncbi:hypothetical protein PILCRDRAFT_3635 [Piloderma croceum F 1598]|uniref:Uncharacterized protein n=1 Tax=Piloderma croceum (strain F 1598) TaxID=765440 RepID=A0A0C3GBB6_PILCF|nr:hypothetical protein PILCRDRAFT_3635 [Piloderma croceum F 1598]